ncbi:hypothetical protein OIO90_006659, partial [Microbotryomycetes sp. JL221]
WSSHEDTLALTLVCKRWGRAATALLYEAVSLGDQTTTLLFLRTIKQDNPSLKLLVNKLSVGLRDEQEWMGEAAASSTTTVGSSVVDRGGLSTTSALMVEAIELCTQSPRMLDDELELKLKFDHKPAHAT